MLKCDRCGSVEVISYTDKFENNYPRCNRCGADWTDIIETNDISDTTTKK